MVLPSRGIQLIYRWSTTDCHGIVNGTNAAHHCQTGNIDRTSISSAQEGRHDEIYVLQQGGCAVFQTCAIGFETGATGMDKRAAGNAWYCILTCRVLIVGYFKASFDGKIDKQDTVGLSLYKRIWPRLGV
jgi:hypothetical protein